jgi:hypothetical protein
LQEYIRTRGAQQGGFTLAAIRGSVIRDVGRKKRKTGEKMKTVYSASNIALVSIFQNILEGYVLPQLEMECSAV